MQEEYNLAESSKELHMEPGSTSEEKSPEGPPEEAIPAKLRASQSKSGILLEVSPEEEEEEAKGIEEEELSMDEEEELWELREEEERRPKRSYSMTESFEEELMAQLEEYERMLMDFQSELEFTRTRYSLATGRDKGLMRRGVGWVPMSANCKSRGCSFLSTRSCTRKGGRSFRLATQSQGLTIGPSRSLVLPGYPFALRGHHVFTAAK